MADSDRFGELRKVEGKGGPPAGDEFGTLERIEGRAGGVPMEAESFAFAPLDPVEGRPAAAPELVAATPRRAGAVGALLAVGFLSTLIALLMVVNRALPPAVLETPSSLPSAEGVPEVNAVAEPTGEGTFEPVPEATVGPATRTGSVAVGPAPSGAGTPTSEADRASLRDQDLAIREDDGGPAGGGGDRDGGGNGNGSGGGNGGGGNGGGGNGGAPDGPDGGPGKGKGHAKGKGHSKDHGGGHQNGHGRGNGKAKGHDKGHAGGGGGPGAGGGPSSSGGGNGGGGSSSGGNGNGNGHAKARGNGHGGSPGKGHGKD